jgi:hypothetical protein
MMANMFFALAAGSALLLQSTGVSESVMLLVLVSVLTSAIITNLMFIKSTRLVGIGGLSLAYSQFGAQSQAARFLMILIAALITGAVVLMIFADLPNSSKRSHSDEISES